MQRIHSIDYLRGLMALAVLIYHFMSWTVGVPDSSTIIGRLGIYGVSTFYIVSGMSLFLAYKDSTWSPSDCFSFAAKRYLRLLPAFWVACTLVVVLVGITSPTFVFTQEKIVSNYTLSFGFFAPDLYITTGGWSIGNEMVFYAFFPFVLMLPRHRAGLLVGALVASFAAYCYFAFFELSASDYLGNQWRDYVNPFNQAFLFIAGVFIAWVSIELKLIGNKWAPAVLVLSVLAFCLYPASGDPINITQGWNRLAFTAICIACGFSVLTLRIRMRPALEKILFAGGYLSYPVYMFHGVFADASLFYIPPLLGVNTAEGKLAILFCVTLPLLLVFCFGFFKYVESPAMGLGRHLKQGRRTAEAL